MKTKPDFTLKLLLLTLFGLSGFAQAQGNAISYQGRLNEGGVPVTGLYDFTFVVFDAVTDGAALGSTALRNAVPVINGLFGVSLDFGPGVFTGPARWLQIEVRPLGGVEFTPLTPRQEITAAPYALRAQTAGNVASGSVSAEQFNTAGPPATTGQFLSYDGGSLYWSDPSGFRDSLFSLNGTTAYYNNGSVAVGTDSPEPGIRLQVNGATRLTPGGSGGAIQWGTPAGETGMSIFSTNRADIRFDDAVLKLTVGLGSGAPPAANGITINHHGFVGVGTLYPNERLSVGGDSPADTKMEIRAGGNNYAAIRIVNNVSSWLWQATPSTDLPGGRLRLTDEAAGAERISITQDGDVGIGIKAPIAKLHVDEPQAGKAAVYGVASSTASVGVYGSANAASSVGVWGHNSDGPAIYADGNAAQARDKGGFVKAMAFINPFLPPDQYVARCYNSAQAGAAATSSPCGISVTRFGTGFYQIDFEDSSCLVGP